MPSWTYHEGNNKGRSYRGSGMVDDAGQAVKAGNQYRTAQQLARAGK
jgi:hypothetical protein